MVPGVACLALSNALALAIPKRLGSAVAALSLPSASHGRAAELVAHAAFVMAALAVGQAVARIGSRVLLFSAGRNVESQLREQLFARLLTLDPAFFLRRPTGELMSRLVNDLQSIRMLVGFGLLNVVNAAIVLTASLAMLLRIDRSLTFAALAPLPLALYVSRRLAASVFRLARSTQDTLGHLTARLQEDFATIQLIKTLGLEPLRREELARVDERYTQDSIALARTRGLIGPLLGMVGGLGAGIALSLGGSRILAGRLTVAQLVTFNAYLAMLAWPATSMGWLAALWQRGLAAWQRVQELMAEVPTLSDGPTPPPSGWRGELEVRDLTVDYRRTRATDAAGDGRAALAGVSFHVRAGERVAVVGRTGAGKSTLVDALTRMVPIATGTVFLDGLDVTTLPLDAVRQAIRCVPQDAFLFSATVAANILQGDHDGGADRDYAEGTPLRRRLEQALRVAELQSDLAEWPDGLETPIGERGLTLSGGQRQRVTLARALMGRGAVFLFDDTLAAVDVETERRILAALSQELRGVTCLFVSHRAATVAAADRILVLDQGRIVEQGTPAELLSLGGLYASLQHRQELQRGLEPEPAAAPPERP
jgi:ATP-binding cassette subfamily B protein